MVFGAGFGWRFVLGRLGFPGTILAERLIVAVVKAVPFAWGLVARPLNPGTHRIRFWNPRPVSRFSEAAGGSLDHIHSFPLLGVCAGKRPVRMPVALHRCP
jgi:hypothetical protein